MVADGNKVGVSAGTGMRMNVVTKNKRRTVNGAPRLDRALKDNKNFKAGRKLRNYNFASESLNDKNAANV
jgi:hypothetical protein